MASFGGVPFVPTQAEGSWHFRTTFLPPEDEMEQVIERLGTFHSDFMARYA